MNEYIAPVATWLAVILETLGVATIAVFALYALFKAAVRMLQKGEADAVFQELRQRLGRGILLGLEFLIAADIIYTVAIELTFETVGVLAIIVIIRTFLSLTLEVEMYGSWPWQDKQ